MNPEDLIIKVCGMRDPSNVEALSNAGVQWIGLIFYPKSKRFVSSELEIETTEGMQRVGVFVDETIEKINQYIQDYKLDIVQLHGLEDPAYCASVQRCGVKVLKAFSIDDSFDFSQCDPFMSVTDYFLFDAKGDLPGGNGIAYDWNILNNYQGQRPFLLSGGIDLNHVAALKNFEHPSWIGIDINSRFEIHPALKNIEKIKQFKHELCS